MARAKKVEEVKNVQAAEAVQGTDASTNDANAVPADLSSVYTPVNGQPRKQAYPDGTIAIHW